ncbi:MAG: phosphoribosylanthranilate isomerase [Vicinamibacterales bacterium]
MSSPALKVCGITGREDAWAAVSAGADAIGFVFWPRSPRAVSADVARAIARGLPPFVTRVGVFVDATPEEMRAVVSHVGLDVLQLHGDETPDVLGVVGVRALKAVGRRGAALAEAAGAWPTDVPIVVDAVAPTRRGGTGERADWVAAARLAIERPVILAGGLTPENVADAIHIVRPVAVDVSSGVELRPGVKDHVRLRAFADAVSRA